MYVVVFLDSLKSLVFYFIRSLNAFAFQKALLIFIFSILTSYYFSSTLANAAEEIPSSFTYQGRFMNAAGTSPLADSSYTIKFSIYDPTDQCLLYEESQSVTTSNGFFSVRVGSNIGDLKRTANNIICLEVLFEM